MKLLGLTIVACGLLAIAGCGSDSQTETRSEEAIARSKPDVPQGPPSDELIVNDLEEGTGLEAQEGDRLSVHYVAGIYETGEEIEAAWDPKYYLGNELGTGEWVGGWEEGMQGMRVGGRRELIFPTTPKDTPPGSKPGDTLVYVVDLLEIERPDSR